MKDVLIINGNPSPKKKFSWFWFLFWLVVCFPIGIVYFFVRH
jgi:hypothetical protein